MVLPIVVLGLVVGVAAGIKTSRKVGDLLGIAALLIVSTWVARSGLDGQVVGAYFGAALIGIMAAKAVNVYRKKRASRGPAMP